jgi:hypothetical protein
VAHLQQESICDVGGALDLPSGEQFAAHDARAKLDRRFDLGGATHTDTADELLQFGGGQCEQTAQAAGRNQQLLSGLQVRYAGDDGQQFGVGEGRDAWYLRR